MQKIIELIFTRSEYVSYCAMCKLNKNEINKNKLKMLVTQSLFQCRKSIGN